VSRRAIPALLLAAAALADVAGSGRAAFYLLLTAVPALAAAALTVLGEVLDGRPGATRVLQVALLAIALALAVAGAAARSPMLLEHAVPPFAVYALAAGLFALALEALVGLRLAVADPRGRRRAFAR
jgi:hypothetical protein